nr:hypothetical protein [Mesorhizobium loti]
MVTKLRDKLGAGLSDQKPIEGPGIGIIVSLALIIAMSMFGIAYLAMSIF